MKIILKKTLDVTPALETYIDTKIQPLEKFLKPFEENGDVELHLEVARTTNHHNKGEEVYQAVASLQIHGKVLRSEASASDIHKAIDEVRNILHMEIEKYKEKHLNPHQDHERGEK
jgi:ribosomal subunit interface protein